MPISDDIRKGLEARITAAQKEIGILQEQRGAIEGKLKVVESKLSALRAVYQIEALRFGETKAPLFSREGASHRFAGIKLTEALDTIRRESPGIDKKQALKKLQTYGFDFRGKRPLPAVHFAWVALSRRKKRR